LSFLLRFEADFVLPHVKSSRSSGGASKEPFIKPSFTKKVSNFAVESAFGSFEASADLLSQEADLPLETLVPGATPMLLHVPKVDESEMSSGTETSFGRDWSSLLSIARAFIKTLRSLSARDRSSRACSLSAAIADIWLSLNEMIIRDVKSSGMFLSRHFSTANTAMSSMRVFIATFTSQFKESHVFI
jgi:hypothetical protein